jgi:DNA-directed RNA polymerase specialized sigma24 family protein
MKLVLGWKHDEIAAEYELSPDAVRKAYSRVISDFRRELEVAGMLSWPEIGRPTSD